MRKAPSRKQLVRVTKERWRTERVYEDLKGELGLDHYEGRSFRGWNHHVRPFSAAAPVLLGERLRDFPPREEGAGSSLFARVRGMSVTSRTPSSLPASRSRASSSDGSLAVRAAITPMLQAR